MLWVGPRNKANRERKAERKRRGDEEKEEKENLIKLASFLA